MAERNLKPLNKDIPEQMGVVVKVTNKKLFFNIEDRVGIKHIIEWIRGEKYTKVVLPIRTDAEINHPQNVPHEKVIGYFKKEFDRVNKFGKVIEKNVFLFIQDPWPDPLKPFNIDDKTFVVRFTYDEGCEIDKTWRKWDKENGYYMLTRYEVVKL